VIGFFPDPLPDELLYSACARYHVRAGYRSRERTGHDLFGETRAIVAVDLPCHLDTLIAVLPPGHRYTAERLIEDHTLLPLYRPFVPSERVSLLYNDIRGRGGGSIHTRLGILTSGTKAKVFRYCPICVEDDRERFGEAYWHRLHQAPGVEVCPAHKVFLEDSLLHTRHRANHVMFVTAEQVIGTAKPRSLNKSDRRDRVSLRIAEDIDWLLKRTGLTSDQPAYRDRYINLLSKAGLSNPFGKMKTGDLAAAMDDYYSPEFLESLNCGFRGKKKWLQRLVHNHGRAQHPLKHLLLMQFLGYTAAAFFQLPLREHPFGQGPWPCLNRAAEHYRQPVIAECEVSLDYRHQRPRGTFRCRCGFAYSRFGPDRSEDDRFLIGRYVTYGKVWEGKLKEMRAEGETGKEIARRLCISARVILQQIANFHLQPDSQSTKETVGRVADNSDLREEHRRVWEAARQRHPEARRSALAVKVRKTYTWLCRYDREWFEQNSPACRVSAGAPRHVDWRKRDSELSEAARKEAARLRAAPGRPVRVTASGIARALGAVTTLGKNGHLLPQTVKTLAKVSEGVEEAAIRRVNWAAECYRSEGIRPSRKTFKRRAGISDKVARRPVIMSAILSAMLSIKPSERATASITVSA